MKKQNGITLIALVITIIVLLILAGVSLTLVLGNNGVLTQAQKSVKNHSEAEVIEQIKLAYSAYEIAKAGGTTETEQKFIEDRLKEALSDNSLKVSVSNDKITVNTTVQGKLKEYSYDLNTGLYEEIGKWIDNGNYTYINSATGLILKIGDKINYDEGTGYTFETDISKGVGGSVTWSNSQPALTSRTCSTENLTWRILGVNNQGQLELISENPTSEKIYIVGENGYLYAPQELDNICNKLYGRGKLALMARNLNADDINKLAGILKEEDKKELNVHYGNKWEFRYPTTREVSGTRYMQYRIDSGTGFSSWKNTTNNSRQKFIMPGEEIFGKMDDSSIIEGYSPVLTINSYDYELSSKIEIETSDGKNISDILGKGISNGTIEQFVSTARVDCLENTFAKIGQSSFGIFYISGGILSSGDLVRSYQGNESALYNGGFMRPVVILKSEVKLSGNSTDGFNIE